ncbi:MAG: multidrug efflux RND transporter permease subunit [Rhodospirillales bacterium]|nr:multidrug efflux RND transporter permease subunit [Rhodospirillales bacterium]
MQRPIFASVVAIIIVLAGAISMPLLPVAEYPNIAPPTVEVKANYTGGSARVVEESVTTPLEEQINGVEGMMYMSSTSSDDGTSDIIVTFETGYDLNVAAADVQNRVAQAQTQLPDAVVRAGVTVKKQSTDRILIISLMSRTGAFDDLFISNFADIHVANTLNRIRGIGNVEILAERKYAMRIWLYPDKLASLGIGVKEVIDAVAQQNQQAPAGALGQPPVPAGQQHQFMLTVEGRLSEPRQFEDIIVRTGEGGAVVRLRDLGRVELGAETYDAVANVDGVASIPIGVYRLPGANALDLSRDVRAAMTRLSSRFPEGLEYEIIYDTSNFTREAIREVLLTLVQAIGLVMVVILVFLRSWRASLIPAITIPVSLVGTLALMLVLGFSINTLTLFGLVLAVGLVVDDAIIVVENVNRHLEAGEASPMSATRTAMAQVTGPVVATSLVLMAVFVPAAFMPGVTGALYNQFALTIASAVALSAFNALTLTPALCVFLLRRPEGGATAFGRAFENGFGRLTRAYERGVGHVIRHRLLVLFCFALVLFAIYALFGRVPASFIPREDQGYFIVAVQAPDATSLDRTAEMSNKVEAILRAIPGVAHVMMFTGFDFVSGTRSPNGAIAFTILSPWQERTTAETQIDAIMAKADDSLSHIPGATVFAINPPVVRGLSSIGGFDFELQDYAGGSFQTLDTTARTLIAKGSAQPQIGKLFTGSSADTPGYAIDLDRDKAMSLGVNIDDLFKALEVFLGGYYVNDFNKFGRVYRVYLQSVGEARVRPEDVGQLQVRNAAGRMVPLSTLMRVEPDAGASTIRHYNLYRSVSIHGQATPGHSSGEAISAMEAAASEVVPDSMGYEWTGNAYEELKSGNLAPVIFALALVCVFLFLAALYESWIMPWAVILAVPLAMVGALSAQWLRGLENDVYCQIGMVMLVGLASKNAILIVEFAMRRRADGAEVERAAREAASTRFRPILMTALAFIIGILPLLIASGAGANAQRSLGTAVFGGMIAATALSLMLVPVLYIVLERARDRWRRPPSPPARSVGP